MMEWNEQQRKIAESILRYRREDDTYNRKAVMGEIPDVAGSTITKVANALRETNWVIPPIQELETLKEVNMVQSVNIASINQRDSGTIVLTIGDLEIPLNLKILYDAHLYYLDIQRIAPDIDDSFCTVIKTSVKHVWEHFSAMTK